MKEISSARISLISGGEVDERMLSPSLPPNPEQPPQRVLVNGGGNKDDWGMEIEAIVAINDNFAIVPGIDVDNRGINRGRIQAIYRW